MDKQLIELVARALWSIRREDEDQCDLELEDIPQTHSVWKEAEAAIGCIDAERGKDAVAYLRFWAGRMVSPYGGVECDEGLEVCKEGEVGADGEKAQPVFLSPTIPEGMALVPLMATDAMREVISNENCIYGSAQELYSTLLAAAQGERNA